VHYPEIASHIKDKPMEAGEYREFVLSTVVADTPHAFWHRLAERTKFAYGDAYSSVAGDPSLLEEQRSQKLFQERYFKLEYGLISAARESGVPASAQLIGTNLCYYAYAGRGRIGLTQSYVQVSGDMPSPAAFRTQLAEMAEFTRTSRLDLGDEPRELILPKQVFGVVLHSPVGRKFTEGDQKLGAMGFFVAYKDYSGWAAQLAVSEILAAYKPAAVEERDDRAAPTRKPIKKSGAEE
jgi:hypothetical protein